MANLALTHAQLILQQIHQIYAIAAHQKYLSLDLQSCIATCPPGAQSNGTGLPCYCSANWTMSADKQSCHCTVTNFDGSCITVCPPNSDISGKGCKCQEGYSPSADGTGCDCNLFSLDNSTCILECPENSLEYGPPYMCKCDQDFENIDDTLCLGAGVTYGHHRAPPSLSDGAIAGIGIACIVVLGFVIFLIIKKCNRYFAYQPAATTDGKKDDYAGHEMMVQSPEKGPQDMNRA